MAPKTKFDWDEASTAFLMQCYNNLNDRLTVKAKETALLRVFKVNYPNCTLKGSTLFKKAKERAAELANDPGTPVVVTAPRPTWDEETDNYLKECAEIASDANSGGRGSKTEYKRSIEDNFLLKYPGFSKRAVNIRVRTLELEPAFLVTQKPKPSNKVAAKPKVEMYNYLVDCALEAHDVCVQEHSLGLYAGKESTHRRNYLEHVTELMEDRYPGIPAATIKSRISSQGLNIQAFGSDETTKDSEFFRESMRMWELGHKLSQQPLYTGVCSNCSALMTSSRVHPLKTTKTVDFPPKVLVYYTPEILKLPVKNGKGLYYVCGNCSGKRDLLGKFGLCDGNYDWFVPHTIERLRRDEKAQIALLSLSCKIAKYSNPGAAVFEHQVGQATPYPRSQQHYYDLYALMFERSDFQPRNALDRTKFIIEALRTLRKINPLYKAFMSNFETLYRFMQPNKNQFRSFSIRDPIVTKPVDKEKDMDDVLRDEPSGVLLPTRDVGTRGADYLKDIETGTQHPQNFDDARKTFYSTTRVTYDDPLLEQKLFPGLFPFGVGGYDYKLGVIPYGTYLKWRLEMYDNRFRRDVGYLFFSLSHLIKLRLQGFSGAKVNVSELQKKVLRKDVKSEIELGKEKDPNAKYGTEVPHTIPNSRNFWAKKTEDLMAFGEAMKRTPTFLITLTQNDSWPEMTVIHEGPHHFWIAPGDKEFCDLLIRKAIAIDMPVEMAQCFYRRLQAFIDEFIKKPSPIGEVDDYWLRVEYQGRGALHVHLVVWCKEGSVPSNVISAEMPRFDHPCNQKWRERVNTLQRHECRDNCFKWKLGLGKDGKKRERSKDCKHGFPYEKCLEEGLDKNGFRFNYIRREDEDRNIVAYNLAILLFWGAHCNIIRITMAGWELYVAKYIAKCDISQQLTFQKYINNNKNVMLYMNTRMCGSLEAAALLLQKPQVKCSREIIYLPIHINPKFRYVKRLENMKREDIWSENIYYDTKLEKYLDRPTETHHLTYQQFWEQYYPVYGKQASVWGEEEIDDSMKQDYDEAEPDSDTAHSNLEGHPNVLRDMKDRKWKRRLTTSKTPVIRFPFPMPYGPGLKNYCLVKILKNIPITRSTQAILENSDEYLHICIDRNLIDQEQEALQFLESAARRGFRTAEITDIAKKMIEGNWLKDQNVEELLKTVAPEHCALQQSVEEFIEDQEYDEHIDLGVQACKSLEWYVEQFSDTQRRAYEIITNAWENDKAVLVFITGEAGAGKTFLLEGLNAYCKECEKTVQKLATTGSAALNIGGLTIHSWIHCDVQLNCHLQPRTSTAFLVGNVSTLMIDEVSLLEDLMYEKLNSVMQEFSGVDKLFGGKSILMFGDVCQLEAINGNIWQERYLKPFDIMVIRQSQRHKDDKSYAMLCERIRRGERNPEDIEALRSRNKTEDELKTELDAMGLDPTTLVATRIQKEGINDTKLAAVEGEEFHFIAQDVDVGDKPLSAGNQKYVDDHTKHWNLLKKDLKLKVGAKVILTRNKSIQTGWVNGTQAVVENITQDYIQLRSEKDPNNKYICSRLKESTPETTSSSKYFRKQFCVELAFACTVHKSQGFTLSCVIVHCKKLIRSGQFYTAISRVPSLDKLYLVDFDESVIRLKPHFRDLMLWMDDHDLLNPNRRTRRLPMPKVPSKRRRIGDVVMNNLPDGSLPGSRNKGTTAPDPEDTDEEDAYPDKSENLVGQVVEDTFTADVHKNPDVTPPTARKLFTFKTPTGSQAAQEVNEKQRTPTKRLNLSNPSTPTKRTRPDKHANVRNCKHALAEIREIPTSLASNLYCSQAIRVIQQWPGLRKDVFEMLEFQLQFLPILWTEAHSTLAEDEQFKLAPCLAQGHCVVKTTGDNHCLYRAFSTAIFDTEDFFIQMRFICVCIFLDHQSEFEGCQPLMLGETLNQIIHNTCLDGGQLAWGHQAHLKAMAIATNRQVWRYSEPRFGAEHDQSAIAPEMLNSLCTEWALRYHPLTANENASPIMVFHTNAGTAVSHYSTILPCFGCQLFPPAYRGDVRPTPIELPPDTPAGELDRLTSRINVIKLDGDHMHQETTSMDFTDEEKQLMELITQPLLTDDEETETMDLS